jgi:hypothetical protein
MWQMVLLMWANYMWWYEFVIVGFAFFLTLFVLGYTSVESNNNFSVHCENKKSNVQALEVS